MTSDLLGQFERFVGFGPEDEANLRALAGPVESLIPGVVSQFYEAILRTPRARRVISAGDEQLARLRVTLQDWLASVFAGRYDEAYVDSRFRIGVAHVRVGLPQKYMPLAMEVVWRELVLGLRAKSVEGLGEKLRSLHKILTFDLTVMLEGYKDCYAEQARELERRAMEAKLSRAEHLAEIGQLAASLAHEIKNPLAGISGAIQVIGDSLGSESPYRSVVRDILGQISRMDATVKDLLLFARPTPANPRICQLDKLVLRVLQMLQEEPALRTVHIEFDEPGKPVLIYADEGQIEQLLINLILNAAHASADSGSIRIEAVAHDTQTILTVRDNGTGMPAEVKRRALEPFYTTKAKGTGLGLAICRRIAESNGGSIELESTPGKGTVVDVTLPNIANGFEKRDS